MKGPGVTGTIVVVNSGSSSVKFELFDLAADGALAARLEGRVEGIGTHPRFLVRDADGTTMVDEAHTGADLDGAEAAQDLIGAWIQEHGGGAPVAVGHRVVHGGLAYDRPVAIDDAVLAALEKLVPLAPLHQPHNLAAIRSIRRRRPDLLQVACFDTAFHRGHPEVADRYALPEAFYAEGVRRYGFHGLSYEFIADRLRTVAPDLAAGRTVVAHLGSGCSMCAIAGGRSVESTMGFTALDGLPMGTRPGALDPGVVLYLAMHDGMKPDEIQHLLYADCGLKGLSGISGDMRDLEASDDPRARLALDYFAYRAAMAVGSLAAAMGGLDGLVFTAGVGENAPAVRAAIVARLGFLGLAVDPEANARHDGRISPAGGPPVLVVPTDEELMIARHTVAVLAARRGGGL